MKIREFPNSQKDRKKKTSRYCGKTGHAENTYCKKSIDLEETIKKLEGYVIVVQSTSRSTDKFTFNVETSQALLDHNSQNEWVVDVGFTHHLAKDASVFSSSDIVAEKKTYVVDDFSLDLIDHGDVTCQLGWIIDIYHVPSLSTNLLSISQLT